MIVLITGGTGTISSGLVQECVNRGYTTYAITRGSNKTRNVEGAIYLQADIRNTNEIRTVLGDLKFDVVIECLAYNEKQLKTSLKNFANKCNQYFFISTAGIYNRVGDVRIKESDKKEFFDWDYAKNKILCENYLKEYSYKTGLIYTIIRPTVTYGNYRIPFPISTRNPGWSFFNRIEKGKPMLASDNVRFSIIHIDDFSKMVVSLIVNKKAINEDFHISGDSNDIYWDDVINYSNDILGTNARIIHVSSDVIKKIWPQIYDEIKYHKNTSQIFSSTKIKNATGLSSSIVLQDGLRRIIKSMKNEYLQNDLLLDNVWDIYCDATIYYAYKHNLLSKNESEVVKNYIEENGELNMKKALNYVKKNNKKKLLDIVKLKMKKVMRLIK